MDVREWKLGDRVIHAGRPEWGVGEVRGVVGTVEAGAKCQRLTVRFDRVGVKTLSTAYANLTPAPDRAVAAEAAPAVQAGERGSGDRAAKVQASAEPDPWAASDDGPAAKEQLVNMPDAATDPFRSRRARLEYSVGLYRFSGTGGSLLDWAASQTGLKDPLSRFSRHELEQFYGQFRINLDTHVKRLAAELRKENASELAAVAAAAPPAARHVLGRFDAGR